MSLLRRGGLSSIDLMFKEVTDMSDYETFSLVILIIGLVISALSLGITIGKRDKIIVINTGDMSRGYRTTPYPSPFILDRIKEKKIPITVTTDCHNRFHLSFGMEEAKEMLREEGFKEYMVLGDHGFYPTSL